MIKYIEIKLRQLKGKSPEEQFKIMNELYQDLEDRGMKHEDIFIIINSLIINNLSLMVKKLVNQMRK